MSDIVERLRTLGTEWAKATGERGPGVASLQREAADEIARLRAVLADIAAFSSDPGSASHARAALSTSQRAEK